MVDLLAGSYLLMSVANRCRAPSQPAIAYWLRPT
jgi:hypothetical protein